MNEQVIQVQRELIEHFIEITSENAESAINVEHEAINVIGAENYDGAYDITPRLYVQSLATESKVMKNDVTVYEIPIVSTTNPKGGKTVLIG